MGASLLLFFWRVEAAVRWALAEDLDGLAFEATTPLAFFSEAPIPAD
jgi:hypothetical protein